MVDNIPDPKLPQRRSGGGSKKPKVQLLPQPKPVNYGITNEPLKRYEGYVLDWNDKNRFGKRIPGPHKIKLHCYATNRDHAHTLLHMQAKEKGWALCGVMGIHEA